MTDKEKQKHMDAFKYWCETNEECGVITIPKFVCDNIIKILDKAPTVTPDMAQVLAYESGKASASRPVCKYTYADGYLQGYIDGSTGTDWRMIEE